MKVLQNNINANKQKKQGKDKWTLKCIFVERTNVLLVYL